MTTRPSNPLPAFDSELDYYSSFKDRPTQADAERDWRAARKQVRNLAQIIFERAYEVQLAALVGPLLPAGMPLHIDYVSTMPELDRRLLLRLSHRDLLARAAKQAREETKSTLHLTVHDWTDSAADHLTRGRGMRERRSETKDLLYSALNEMNHAPAAFQCVRFWLHAGIRDTPASWAELRALLQGDPELERRGLKAMLKRGWVSPPWLTAAMA